MIEDKIKAAVRDIPDFPKPGIVFKDITPILKDPDLCSEIIESIIEGLEDIRVDAIAGIESRGFLFGLMLANRLKIPFIPIRKQGKLPHKTISHAYELEYGSAVLEVHEDAFEMGSHVLIHDDLLATGGTVTAASVLIEKLGGKVAGYSFLIGLDFLNGKDKLLVFSNQFLTLATY